MTTEEILAFGKRLVDEYGIEPGGDTLSRWLLHHIAELIRDAEKATSAEIVDRRAAAASAILEFWEHRRSLDTIDPLRDLRPLLSVIKTLDPNENRWVRSSMGGSTALPDLYSAVRQIFVFVLLSKSGASSTQDDESKFLSEEENEILSSVNIWLSEYQKEALKAPPKKRSRKRQPEGDVFSPTEHVLSQIADARQALDALERELRGLPPIPKPNPYELLISEEPVQIRIIPAPPNENDDDNSSL